MIVVARQFLLEISFIKNMLCRNQDLSTYFYFVGLSTNLLFCLDYRAEFIFAKNVSNCSHCYLLNTDRERLYFYWDA